MSVLWTTMMQYVLENPAAVLGGSVVVFCGGALCSGAGMGGGAFYLPVFIVLLGYDVHRSVALSKAVISGVAVGSYLVLYRSRHPTADRPLIHYGVAALIEPATLVGTLAGVLLNILSPAPLILLFLIAVLGYTAYKSIRKGIDLWRREREAAAT